MKNFKLIEKKGVGYPVFSLISLPEYNPLFCMEAYCFYLASHGRSRETIKAYANAVARFLDFVVEIATLCFDGRFVKPESYHQLIHMYFQVINGCDFRANALLSEVKDSLKMRYVSSSTDKQCQAAIRSFMQASSSFDSSRTMLIAGHEASSSEVARLSNDFYAIGSRASVYEHRNISVNSYLSGCISGGVQVPKAKSFIPNYSGPGRKQGLKSHVINLEDFLKIVAVARNARDRFLFILLAATGIRLSEALQILMIDIDFKNRRILIVDPKTRPYEYVRRGLCTDEIKCLKFKGRTTPKVFYVCELEESLWQEFKCLLSDIVYMPVVDSQGKYVVHDFIFRNAVGDNLGKPICLNTRYSSIERTFNRCAEEAGVDCEGLHGLRHFWVSHLYNVYGFPIEKISKLAGHSSVEVTERYCHVDMSAQRIRAENQAQRGMGFISVDLMLDSNDESW